MAKDSSATMREQAPHLPQIPYGDQPRRTNTIVSALTQRAHAVVNDTSIDAHSRAIIRYALETNDPWLARLVRRVDAGRSICVSAGESLSEVLGILETPDTQSDSGDASAALVQEQLATLAREKTEALTEIICGAGNRSAAALLVLMGILASSTDSRALANAAKHFAFTRCGELNLYGMVEAQIAVVEDELLT